MVLFRDRAEAGRELAGRLADHGGLVEPVVLGLPRGGVPVAAEVAASLSAPLDVFMVRKLGVPGQPELAMGAIASGGVQILNESVVRQLKIEPAAVEQVVERELLELRRREREYRGDRPVTEVTDRTVILVDDGLATGATMRAAVQGVRVAGAGQVVVAVPVGATTSCQRIEEVADELMCLHAPASFGAVGSFYGDFRQVTDDEVRRLLDRQPGR